MTEANQQKLFQPITINGLELKNRFMRSATWDATADETGLVSDSSVEIYRKLGEGGIGLIVSGFAFISLQGQALFAQYGIHNDEMIPGLRRMVKAARQGDSKIAVQIVHAGINSTYHNKQGSTSLAVSASLESNRPHREMTEEDIELTIDDFASAAGRAREAGFDAIQLHGAHGYLMSQFASPSFNRRTDQWGGNPENRRRFYLEVVRRVRKTIGDDFPLMIKFGVVDDREGGLTLEEGIETARQITAAGVDAIEISGGVGQPAGIAHEGEPEQTPFRERAAQVKKNVSVPVMLVSGIRNLETAREIITSGDADMLSMCRPLIREPGLVARWQWGETDLARCISCGGCYGITGRGEPLECNQERKLRESS